MPEPKRGEIWRAWFSDHNSSSEIREDHPCLIVSHDDYNLVRDRVAVVPITSYISHAEYRKKRKDNIFFLGSRREEMRSLWGVTITNKHHVQFYRENKFHVEQREGLLKWLDREQSLYYKSVIDCGQIRTILKTKLQNDLRSSIYPDRRHGQLKETQMIEVETALQALVGGGVHFYDQDREKLTFQEGDVIELAVPSIDRLKIKRFTYLVISSTGIDAIRERLYVTRNDSTAVGRALLNQITVIELTSNDVKDTNSLNDSRIGNIPIRIQSGSERHVSVMANAICTEIHTIDWQAKQAEKFGHVEAEDLQRVRDALCDYLMLQIGRNKTGHDANSTITPEMRAAAARTADSLRTPEQDAYSDQASSEAFFQMLDLDQQLYEEIEREQYENNPVALEKEGTIAGLSNNPSAREAVIKWISSLWQPQWAGELVTAAHTAAQKNTFYVEDQEINITCSWAPPEREYLAYIHIEWVANLTNSGELWVRFIQPETNILLSELRLGSHLDGEARFSTTELGFDPSVEKWAMELLLKDINQ